MHTISNAKDVTKRGEGTENKVNTKESKNIDISDCYYCLF